MGKIAASLRQQKETEKDDAKKVRGMYSLSLWALGGTATNLGLEYDDIGSLRLTIRGERHCVFVHLGSLQTFLKNKSYPVGSGRSKKVTAEMAKVDAAFPYLIEECEEHLKGFNIKDLKEFAGIYPGSLVHHTCTPADVLYTPTGWLIAESIPDQKTMAAGFRSACLAKCGASLLTNISQLRSAKVEDNKNVQVELLKLLIKTAKSQVI